METKTMTLEELRESILVLHGWKEIDGPKWDYNGACEWEKILVPPGHTDDYCYPPKGKVARGFFYNGVKSYDYCNDLGAAMSLFERLPGERRISEGNGTTVWWNMISNEPHMPVWDEHRCVAIAKAYYQWKTGIRVEVTP